MGLGDQRVKPKVWKVYERKKKRRQQGSDEVVEREKEN